jgi:protein required for attachment to host cells
MIYEELKPMKDIKTDWIVVASRDQVRIFSKKQGPHPLELITEIGNPSGRLRLKDLESDKPGRASDNRMHARHAYSKEEDAITRSTRDFYRQIVDLLVRGAEMRRFSQLNLIAEPRLLGFLRQMLPESLQRAINHEIAKDLSYEKAGDIKARLESSL